MNSVKICEIKYIFRNKYLYYKAKIGRHNINSWHQKHLRDSKHTYIKKCMCEKCMKLKAQNSRIRAKEGGP